MARLKIKSSSQELLHLTFGKLWASGFFMLEKMMKLQTQPLPEKVDRRLEELLEMKEFDAGEVAWCRATYWAARADWHKTLVDCYAAALARQAQIAGKTAFARRENGAQLRISPLGTASHDDEWSSVKDEYSMRK
jgi:ADP-ribosylglycohydrolase